MSSCLTLAPPFPQESASLLLIHLGMLCISIPCPVFPSIAGNLPPPFTVVVLHLCGFFSIADGVGMMHLFLMSAAVKGWFIKGSHTHIHTLTRMDSRTHLSARAWTHARASFS